MISALSSRVNILKAAGGSALIDVVARIVNVIKPAGGFMRLSRRTKLEMFALSSYYCLMFNSIQGIVSEKLGDGLRLLTGGVEWEFVMPATDINQLPAVGGEGRVFTWLYHKENEMRLFGFADENRRATFLELLKVEGIGPKAAVKIMGGISQEALETALESEDLARLEAVPGLGRKTAQKMILALKGRLAMVSSAPQISSPYNELVEALAGMGYDKRAAADALARAEAGLPADISGAEKEKLLFKQAIVFLSSQ